MPLREIEIHLVDVEPFTSFVAKVLRAESYLQELTTEESAALPDAAVAGFLLLTQAVRELGGAVPSKASLLAGRDRAAAIAPDLTGTQTAAARRTALGQD
jgi:hypothetical protein